MEYGINIRYLTKSISMERAAEAVAKAGFTMLDYTPLVQEDTWEADMKRDMAVFKENGLTVHQTHAPFNRYSRYGDVQNHKICLDRCMEATAYLGAKYVAVHGDEFDFENITFSPEAALEYNHNYFAPYVKQAKEIGCKLGFETVFEDNMTRYAGKRRFTSEPEELLSLIQSFHSKEAVCCWDFGHAHVSFPQTAAEYIRKFGSLIQCTHVHDNTGVDAHAVPLTGDIKWNEMMTAFQEISYSGVLNIEYSHGNIPEELLDDFLKLTYQSAVYLWKMTGK